MEKKEDMVKNTVTISMDREKFVKSVGLGDYKGKIKSVRASMIDWKEDSRVEIDVVFEMEDRLKQIDYTKTVKSD